MPRSRRRNPLRRMASWGLKPNQKMRWTGAGVKYLAVWLTLLGAGLYQQINLILLVAGFAAGPLVASFFVSAAILRKVKVSRRSPSYVFAGEPLTLDYTLENARKSTAALAMSVEDVLAPADRTIPAAAPVWPRLSFARVAAGEKGRVRWQGPTPARGRYQFGAMELVTRSPFGLIERREIIVEPGEILIYPQVGHLARRWHQMHRESSSTSKGRRHDRTAQQQEYHGLREYRSGDSPRWIHWRTTARIGKPMIKEFEQQNEQDFAILLDLWLPRSKVSAEQREAIEAALRFTATVCVESSRRQGRRMTLGWTGPTPGIRSGPASAKLLQEMLEQLAVMRPATEGQLSGLLDALPPATLREAMLVIVSTRPINLVEEAERSTRLSDGAGRGLAGRVLVLDVSRGDLNDLISFGDPPSLQSPRRAEAVS